LLNLQNTITQYENQLNANALRITELEQELMREQFSNKQLQDALNACREKLSKLTDEQNRLVKAW
jgi:chromosome segregation ATPase